MVDIKGFNYTSFVSDGFRQGHTSNALTDMTNQTGSEWVALCIFEYQSTPASHDIAPNTTGINPSTNAAWSSTSTPEDLLQAVMDARDLNKKIMLKPHVDNYSGEWRAAIDPGTAWFFVYTAMLLKYALFAEKYHIEMLCIGVEYIVATQSRFTSNWQKLISEIRKIYSGKLVYASNWSAAYEYGITTAEFLQVEFWNDLDFIGIDVYYPITKSITDNIPSKKKALKILEILLNQIDIVSSNHRKGVILTEIGIQSVKGALAVPWNYSLGTQAGAVQENNVQEFYYRTVIETFGKQSWCSGIFCWNWDSIATTKENTNYTVRNKPAAEILKKFYLP